MKHGTIFGDFEVLEVLTFNDINIESGFDDRGEIFHRFSMSDDLDANKLSSNFEFFYRSIEDLILDTNNTVKEIDFVDTLDDNTKIIVFMILP